MTLGFKGLTKVIMIVLVIARDYGILHKVFDDDQCLILCMSYRPIQIRKWLSARTVSLSLYIYRPTTLYLH